jgi:sporulation protein YlmC with PRC-barrel domain
MKKEPIRIEVIRGLACVTRNKTKEKVVIIDWDNVKAILETVQNKDKHMN